ncbi:MBOAT family protein [Sphingobacteriales bacterium UPWRP_1]|nr:membrane-bound O-acyltransferase family protein [Sphingobacteriales bacterium TSM_CSS]PSJ72956.1 MBOAT family protein [Sphingobacteriales bacterium UPWRP_1]
MVFSSIVFLFLFLPLNLLFYYAFKDRNYRNIVLVGFSLFFYAWGEPVWITLLILSAFVDYLNGLFIEKYRNRPIAKLGIYSTLIFNVGLLMLFKYADFIAHNINMFFPVHIKEPGFILPIGISFYTFQTISYTIDVYYGHVKAQRSFLNFLMFVSLYHQLVAGPIVRYEHIAREIDERLFSWEDFNSGVVRFCIGLFKKVAIANIAGDIGSGFLDGDFSTLSVAGGWLGLVMFTIQIYFDFSGYSDMAIGLGRMFGFHYHENFRYPYLSASITDFWRRWHISLGSFFRDYIYIPLGGSKSNTARNLFIVWGLTGLWHGASWNFVIWGLYFGFIIYAEKILLARILLKVPSFVRHTYSLFLIILGWAIFYFTDLYRLAGFLKIIFGATGNALIDFETTHVFYENLYWLILAVLLCFPVYHWFQDSALSHARLRQAYWYVIAPISMLLFVVSVALLVGSSYNPFLYFRF